MFSICFLVCFYFAVVLDSSGVDNASQNLQFLARFCSVMEVAKLSEAASSVSFISMRRLEIAISQIDFSNEFLSVAIVFSDSAEADTANGQCLQIFSKFVSKGLWFAISYHAVESYFGLLHCFQLESCFNLNHCQLSSRLRSELLVGALFSLPRFSRLEEKNVDLWL